MSKGLEVGCAAILGRVGEDLKPGAHLNAPMT